MVSIMLVLLLAVSFPLDALLYNRATGYTRLHAREQKVGSAYPSLATYGVGIRTSGRERW